MKGLAIRSLLVVALVSVGWFAGRAQTSTPDFKVRISAPEGKTTIECVRGCTLAWVERMNHAEPPTAASFSFACSNSGGQPCPSGRVGGWLKR